MPADKKHKSFDKDDRKDKKTGFKPKKKSSTKRPAPCHPLSANTAKRN